MHEAATVSLSAWENFYIIVGSSAGALTGLMFVVITLIAGTQRPGAAWSVRTFSTPTVVHFGAVLLAASLLSAPWQTLTPPALLLGLISLGGIAYDVLVLRRLQRGISYQPVMEDWLWFGVLPFGAYVALLVTALLLPGSPVPALFGIGATLVLLLFLGVRNAWDVVTYVAIELDTFPQQNGHDTPHDTPHVTPHVTPHGERDVGAAGAE
jgi:hypothetical protein